MTHPHLNERAALSYLRTMILLTNGRLQLRIAPDADGRIAELQDLRTGRTWCKDWHESLVPALGASWDVEVETPRRTRMRCRCSTLPLWINRSIELAPRRARFRVSYILENESAEPLAFLFKLRPGIQLESEDRLILPRNVRPMGSWSVIQCARTGSRLKFRYRSCDLPYGWPVEGSGFEAKLEPGERKEFSLKVCLE